MRRLTLTCALLLAARGSIGQVNTTPATASNFIWGQKTTSVLGGDTTTEFWFTLQGFENRSYCVEVGNFEGIFGDIKTDPIVEVYRSGLVTIAEGIDRQDEPDAAFHRACWTLPSASPIFVRLNRAFTSHANSYVTLRFVETTLFCPWFFIAGDYNAFSLLRNTSRTTLPGVIVTWRGLNGVIAGQTTVTIPDNGTVILNARDFVDRALYSNGSIEIAYPGAPDQIKGSTTTLSGTTGLGFDALFEQRKPW